MAETSLARYFQQTGKQAVTTPLSVADTGAAYGTVNNVANTVPDAVDTSAASIGGALQDLAGAVDEIAQRDEKFWVQKTMSEIDGFDRNLWDTSVSGATNGAQGFTQNYLGNLDKRYDDARKSAPSTRALRTLDVEILNHRTQRSAAAEGFETQEKYEFRRDTVLNEADNFSQEMQRAPGIPVYEPTGALVQPGMPAGQSPAKASGYFSTGTTLGNGVNLPDNIAEWQSRYYVPRDFADGKSMSDRSGPVVIEKQVLSNLDWVTDQFGHGKLQINSGYRSPESNVARAGSGPDGPHTHANAIDVQVRDLPQSERNRLYSLFRAAGANAFGFGHGVLHVEWRKGDGIGKGRDGDFEWTYGGAAKYDRVPVAGPSVIAGTSTIEGQSWATPNQYPYLAAVKLTAQNETGAYDLAAGSMTIAKEGDNTLSYGILGLNTSGMLPAFVREYGEKLGLTAKPGSAEFSAQWQKAVRDNPQDVVNAQLAFHSSKIVAPAQRNIIAAGAKDVANDPRAIAFAADMVVQYGEKIASYRLKAGAGATNVAAFINAVSEDAKRNIDRDFSTALGNDPSIRRGLLNRIDNRARDAMTVVNGVGATATGNVPAWEGPTPDIENVPGYHDRMRRIDEMVDTMGGTPNQRRDMKRELRANVTRAWLSRVAEVNPPAAMSALMSGRYDEDLTLTDTSSLRTSTEAAYRSFENEIRNRQKELISNLKTEAETLAADEAASLEATGKSLGRLTDSHMSVLSDQQKSELDYAKYKYETTREIANATNAELPALLEERKPEGDGFAEEQRRYDFAVQKIQERIKAQQNDPAGYVVSTSDALNQSWQEALASNDPVKVSSTIEAIRAAQKRMGIPEGDIKSIPQATMMGNRDALQNAETADAAFNTFMQMRNVFGGQFANVVADMEKGGLAKGWGDVNDLVQSGDILLGKSLARVVHAKAYKEDVTLGVNLAKAGQKEAARLIFDGRVRRAEVPNIIPTGKDEDFDQSSLQIIGDYLGDSLMQSPATMQAAREAALSIYAVDAVLGEKLSGEKLRQSLETATGGVLEYNSDGAAGKFIAPVYGMSQEQFDTIIANVDDKALEGAFIGFSMQPEPVTASMLRGSLQFVSSGNGRYFLRYPGAGLARNADGGNFEIKFEDLMKSATPKGAQENPSDPYSPGGVLSNYDPETGLWKGPQK